MGAMLEDLGFYRCRFVVHFHILDQDTTLSFILGKQSLGFYWIKRLVKKIIGMEWYV